MGKAKTVEASSATQGAQTLRMDKAKTAEAKPTKVSPFLPPEEPKAPKLDQQFPKHFRNNQLMLEQLRTHQMDTPN